VNLSAHETGLQRLILVAGILLAVLTFACGVRDNGQELTIAAAANLNPVFDEIGRAFTARTGVKVVNSYASTAQLAQQIEAGAPFDVFAAADTAHVDKLIGAGRLAADTRAIYARGKLVLWIPFPERVPVAAMGDLIREEVRLIAIASPNAAPYGKAAVQALQATGLWAAVAPKVAYATNINLAREYAASGNTEAAFTSYSLVINARGRIIAVDPNTYDPIDQALAVCTSARNAKLAREFADFVKAGGAEILQRYGYETGK
jgi:molybdate transport system substrate-binding protein